MPLAARHYRTFEEIERSGIAATMSIVLHNTISSRTHLSPVVQQLSTPHWKLPKQHHVLVLRDAAVVSFAQLGQLMGSRKPKFYGSASV
jgi:hypothetical protein